MSPRQGNNVPCASTLIVLSDHVRHAVLYKMREMREERERLNRIRGGVSTLTQLLVGLIVCILFS